MAPTPHNVSDDAKVLLTDPPLDILRVDLPNVVKHEDSWTEISCGMCGANSSRRKGLLRFSDRWEPLIEHICQKHRKALDLTKNSSERSLAIDLVRKRKLSDGDVHLIEAGGQPGEAEVPIVETLGRSYEASSAKATSNSGNHVVRAQTNKRPTVYEEFQEIQALSSICKESKRRRRKSTEATRKDNVGVHRTSDLYEEDDGEEDAQFVDAAE